MISSASLLITESGSRAGSGRVGLAGRQVGRQMHGWMDGWMGGWHLECSWLI